MIQGRTKYPQSNKYFPVTWKGIKTEDGRAASFTCPECGRTASLVDHEIREYGIVLPSVVCPYDCGFHSFIQLEGWEDE